MGGPARPFEAAADLAHEAHEQRTADDDADHLEHGHGDDRGRGQARAHRHHHQDDDRAARPKAR